MNNPDREASGDSFGNPLANPLVDLSLVCIRKEMFYLTMHSTHFICSYMVKDHSDSKRGNTLPPLHGLLFLISSKGSFICYAQTGALAVTRNSSMGPP